MTKQITDRDPVLVEREKTHGNFRNVGAIAQAIKCIYSNPYLPYTQAEALDMIATKIARILCGDPKTKDHWIDIAGYAKLGAEACDE